MGRTGTEPRCRNGHDYTRENTRRGPDGYRICLTCARRASREYARRSGRVSHSNLVPVEPLRRRFLELRDRGQITASSLAVAIGWVRTRPRRRGPGFTLVGDDTRVRRTLGLVDDVDSHGRRVRQRITRSNAVRIADALWMDPVDAGL